MSAFFIRYFVVGFVLLCLLMGCSETEDTHPLTDFTGKHTRPFATEKVPPFTTAPAAPQAPLDGTPFVKSVGYYSDWRLTEPLSGTVAPGTTFFVKVAFSEPMQHKVADDKAARPILYYRFGKQRFRFRVAKHGASGEDFVSGDAKPFGSGTDDYICKYTVPADATDKFRVEIGKFNADLEGNTLAAFYTHEEQLQFGEPLETEKQEESVSEGAPTVKSVGYYSDWKLTKPLSGTVAPGTTFFVKVVFSEPMQYKVADDNTARPILYYRHGKQRFRFRVAEHGASGEDFVSGDAKPFGDSTDDYICKYTVPADATEKFRVEIGKFSADLEGNNLPELYIHEEQLQFGRRVAEEPKTPAASTEVVLADTEQPQAPEDTQPPTVVEAGFYRDPSLTQPITDTIVPPGTSIYTKVVFSEPMQHRSVNIISARPVLSFVKNDRAQRYRVRSGQTRLRALASGDCKPIGDSTREYICKYTVRASDWGTFTLKVGEESRNTAGIPLAAPYVHAPVLLLGTDVMRLSAATIEENKAPGAFIGTLSHISAEVPIYRLLDDGAQASFYIDADGHLRAKVRLNYEQRSEYTLVIEETQTQTRQSFDVQIVDVNDPPVLRLTSTNFYKEDGIGTKIGEVLVSDEDSGDVHEIEVVKGEDYVGVSAGYLVVLKLFDTPSKTIEVEATDSGGLKYKARFHITMLTSTIPPSEPSEPPQEDTQPQEPTNEPSEPPQKDHVPPRPSGGPD